MIRELVVLRAAISALFLAASPPAAGSHNLTANTPTVVLGSGDYACTLTNPQYTAYSSDATVVAHPHTTSLDMNATSNEWSNAYLTTGYNPEGYDSQRCDAYGYGKSLRLPVSAGRAGTIPASISLYTNSNFVGNGGWDIWATLSPSAHTAAEETSSGNNTEIMVWVTHPGLGDLLGDYYEGNPVMHNVRIDGRYWDVLHSGRTSWKPWQYVAFATPSANQGNFTMNNVHLGVLLRWAADRGWIRKGATIQAIDAGFEGNESTGGTKIKSYSLDVK